MDPNQLWGELCPHFSGGKKTPVIYYHLFSGHLDPELRNPPPFTTGSGAHLGPSTQKWPFKNAPNSKSCGVQNDLRFDEVDIISLSFTHLQGSGKKNGRLYPSWQIKTPRHTNDTNEDIHDEHREEKHGEQHQIKLLHLSWHPFFKWPHFRVSKRVATEGQNRSRVPASLWKNVAWHCMFRWSV